jgi:hypothetical protein
MNVKRGAPSRTSLNATPSRRPRFVLPEVRRRAKTERYRAPEVFRPVRGTSPGRHRLLRVFRGLDQTVPFRKYPGDDRQIRRTAERCWVHVSDGPGWMYVAPPKTPPEVRAAGLQMVESPDDEIVVARSYLSNGSSMDLYLDIIHEFLHILQRQQGRRLWLGVKVPYVDRPTEIEAYAFSVAEARRLGVPDSYLRGYLRLPWVKKAEYLRLLRSVGVSVP